MSEPSYVYILTNKVTPNYVKIGMTRREPEIRASELSDTGVLYPFEVYYAEYFIHGDDIERLLHSKFAAYRVSKQREFFEIEPDVVKEALIDYKRKEPTGEFETSTDFLLAGECFLVGLHGYPYSPELAKECFNRAYALTSTVDIGLRYLYTLTQYPQSTQLDTFTKLTVDLMSSKSSDVWLLVALGYLRSGEWSKAMGIEFQSCLRNYLQLYKNDYSLDYTSCSILLRGLISAIKNEFVFAYDVIQKLDTIKGDIITNMSFYELKKDHRTLVQEWLESLTLKLKDYGQNQLLD